MVQTGVSKERFQYIDQFRGLIIILMLVDHSSYYFDAIWKHQDPLDPLFDSWGEVIMRYVGYLCAPGFLMMNGAMVWWSFRKRLTRGDSAWSARWHMIQRGLFLVLFQMTWVNSSWGGFRTFDPWHLGIIACIGISMILITFIVQFHWAVRLAIALAVLLIHPFLLKITYDPENTLSRVLMQTFVDAGEFNKYPVIPWFASGILGSVMATAWIQIWKTDRQRVTMGIIIGIVALVIAVGIRLGRGFGNIFPFSDTGSYSFFFDQKYPPSLFMSLWFFALVVLGVSAFIVLGRFAPKIVEVFSIPGKVPLFFYGAHIAILGVFIKRTDMFYREGGVLSALIGLTVMIAVMLPLCRWYYGVKRRSNNYIIQMI
jgi:uncharacterized membrane protein